MLSGVSATTAGRTAVRTTWQGVEHACGEPPWRSTVKVRVVVLPDAGSVESAESGRVTRNVLEDSEERNRVGKGVPFTKTAVVQIKLEPER